MTRQRFEYNLSQLTDRQKEVLERFLAGDSDHEIASRLFVVQSVVRQHISAICKKMGVNDVDKDRNSQQRADLKELFRKYQPESLNQSPQEETPPPSISSPDSYIERPDVERRCYREIQKRGNIIRIKAPEKMGKKMLMREIFKQANHNNYATVLLNFDILAPTGEEISDYDQFLQWFSRSITQNLNIDRNIFTDYWRSEQELQRNTKCDDYIGTSILPKLESHPALLLGLQSIDKIFPCDFAPEFLSLLRAWFSKGQVQDNWGKLRIVLVHSTESYVEMEKEKSPFNVGEVIPLDEFTTEQIRNLLSLYQVSLNPEKLQQLTASIGGHPYLVNRVIEDLRTCENIDQAISSTSLERMFTHYLNSLWIRLNESMRQGLRDLITGGTIQDEKTLFMLDSIGLVIRQDNQVKIRNNLYSEYFRGKLS